MAAEKSALWYAAIAAGGGAPREDNKAPPTSPDPAPPTPPTKDDEKSPSDPVTDGVDVLELENTMKTDQHMHFKFITHKALIKRKIYNSLAERNLRRFFEAH